MHLSPTPVDATIDFLSQSANFDFFEIRAGEVGLTEQGACQQYCGIDGRKLGVTESLPGFHVEEVIEKSFVARRAAGAVTLRRVAKEAQRREHAQAGSFARDVTPLDANGVGGKAESNRCDARVRRRWITIRDQAVFGICGFPEESEGAFFEVGEKRIEHPTCRARHRGGRWVKRSAFLGKSKEGDNRCRRCNQHQRPEQIPLAEGHVQVTDPTRNPGLSQHPGGGQAGIQQRAPGQYVFRD